MTTPTPTGCAIRATHDAAHECGHPAVGRLHPTPADIAEHGPLMPIPACARHLHRHQDRAVTLDEVDAGLTPALGDTPDTRAFAATLDAIPDPT